MTSALTMTSASATVLPLSAGRSAGSGLSVSGNGMLIGSSISYVLASAQVFFSTGTINAQKAIEICLNGSVASRRFFYPPAQNKHYGMPAWLIAVNEGDIITLQYTGASGDVLQYYGGQTFLTVQAV